ncbi:hypothetical protein AhaeINNSZ174_06675 [Acinetobacter haemolyticus]|uniref:hypothetical protein n=1 Tax=Acinetobacter haemolyticus TaxID=29430 RepID=UPI001331C4B7|nr:hypothetical protein [Acinetobacter haemolyticus]QHI29167.1 hypothetical protein AhaeINNSZ174_06675 [Acinetobacter haemolyticus]
MNNHELEMLITIFWWQLAIATITGFIISSIAYAIYRKMLVRFNRPRTIKTPYGVLYRADNGFYVQKELLEKLNADYLYKNKQRAISILKRRIQLLEQGTEIKN